MCRLSQNNRFAVCKACRGLSLEDSYWIRQENDKKTWEEVNLFHNPLSLFVTEISLSGKNTNYHFDTKLKPAIHTPELTTLGASAKGWVRHGDGLHLHKVGKYEIPAHEILEALKIEHIPYEEAKKIDRAYYLKMQIADYILNNNDRHEQNWGFLMDNYTGKIIGFCPLFDHDHAFAEYDDTESQTVEERVTLYEAAKNAQNEVKMDFSGVLNMLPPKHLSSTQWEKVIERVKRIM